ncbi:MAG TPA: AraC family transcriptional regulator, partial [Vicinamibacteria bacterium]|nr:AraC family transcriptional regulator [Vicinamibacteria bacterium]
MDQRAAEAQRSVAVLPFVNLSGDPDQEYFSDGMAEEVLNALAAVPGLRVAARTSAFSFKGRNLDVRTIGEELDVAHVLEGSVRKAGSRLRIAAQLVSADNGYRVWSEVFDREMTDVF